MDDLISRQAAIEALGDMPMSWADTDAEIQAQEDWKQHREALLNLPTADLSEYSDKLWETAYERGKAEAHPKKGKWEVCNILDYAQRPSGRKILRCPFCGYLTDEFRSMVDYYHKLTHFCPNCGAEMEGGLGNDEHTYQGHGDAREL